MTTICETVRKANLRTVSQMVVNYRHGPLAKGAAGDVWGGDRLPWVKLEDGTDNFAPLQSLDWQVHVYGKPSGDLIRTCQTAKLALRHFPWEPPMRHQGVKKDALYLVRPDGYVALADPTGDAVRLTVFLEERKLPSV